MKTDNNENKNRKNSKSDNTLKLLYIFLVFLSLSFIGGLFSGGTSASEPIRVAFSDFEEQLNAGEVDTVYMDLNAGNIRYTLLTDETRELSVVERDSLPDNGKQFYITDYLNNDDTLSREIVDNGALLKYKSFEGNFWAVVTAILPLAFQIGLIYFIYRMVNKQMNFSTGGSKILKAENTSKIHFSDIIGQDEVIDDIKHLITIMQNKDKYKDSGVRIPKGVLLVGPPGTGKTMIAKALSNEAKMNFFIVNSSSMIDRFVGMGAKNIRDTFAEARKHTPCIIFFDEIDAIGNSRDDIGGNQEGRQTINALLQELDGFTTDSNILVIGATNCYEKLDAALIRSGRFDRKIVINPPMDVQTRLKLLEHYVGNMNNDSLDLEKIARQIAGFTGADIDQICNESKLIMVQNGLDSLTQDTLEEALDKTLFNGNRTRAKYEDDLDIVAHHESGHALSLLLNHMPVARISVVPNTSGVGGMVVQEDSDTQFLKKSDIENRVKSMYAGRIAEELVFGPENITNGASSDLQQANKVLDKYINAFAFDNSYGLIPLDDKESNRTKSELAAKFYFESKNELSKHLDILKGMAEVVREAETMDGDTLKEMYTEMMDAESGKCDETLNEVTQKWVEKYK